MHHYLRKKANKAHHISEVMQAYNMPTGLKSDGSIAIIELGGGYNHVDIITFCKSRIIPIPNIVDVNCGSSNNPGSDADDEVLLDIQVASAAFSYVTGQAANIRMYWANDIIPAVKAILNDLNNGIDILTCSISWGAPEDDWTDKGQTPTLEDTVIAQLPIPFFAAAGDNDSSDGESGEHVDFPASSPHVIGCGGTALRASGDEVVWKTSASEGTGGGVSTIFMPASYMKNPVSKTFRVVPDVAGNADPATGYLVYINGSWQVIGGTSAVSPLYAGFIAGMNPSKDALKNLNQIFWSNPQCFNDITKGNNGAYKAMKGPDACTGLGTPNGQMIYKVLSDYPPPTSAPTPCIEIHHHHQHQHQHQHQHFYK